jgi:hypothetical protein
MKYLKDYKLFESITQEDIEDFLIDFIDDGTIKIGVRNYLDINSYSKCFPLYINNKKKRYIKTHYYQFDHSLVNKENSILLKITIDHSKLKSSLFSSLSHYFEKFIRYNEKNNKIDIFTTYKDNGSFSEHYIIINIKEK